MKIASMSAMEIFFIVVICAIILGLALRFIMYVIKDVLEMGPSILVVLLSIIIGGFIGGKIGGFIMFIGLVSSFEVHNRWVETDIYKKIKQEIDNL